MAPPTSSTGTKSSSPSSSYWRQLLQRLSGPQAARKQQRPPLSEVNTSVVATRYAKLLRRRRSDVEDSSGAGDGTMTSRRVGGTLLLAHAKGPVPEDDTDPTRAAVPACLRTPHGRQALEQGILRLALRVGQASITPAQWRLVLGALPEAEAARIRRFYYDKDRRLALGSVLLQRAAACWILGDGFASLEIERSAHNKPFVRTRGRRLPGWGFNVSHHGEWAVLASERDGSVGTDLVDLRDRPVETGTTALEYLGHFRRHLTPAEWDALVALPEEGSRFRAFFRVWAVKEAYAKALGLGLSFSIRRVECPVVDVDTADGVGAGCDEIMMDGYALGEWKLEFVRLPPEGQYLWCTATGPLHPQPQPPPPNDGEKDSSSPLTHAEPITPGVSAQEAAALRGMWRVLTLVECLPRGLRAAWEQLGREEGRMVAGE